MHDWTIAVAQHSNFACEGTVYLKIWLHNNLYMFTHLTMIFELTNQLNRFKELTLEWIDIANTEYRYTAIRIPVYRYF
jgi:hypothetical protein